MRWWPLVGVAALAAALRWFRIDAQSLWYDEGISAHQLTRSFPEILRAAALDTHPPLYYWTLKAWGDPRRQFFFATFNKSQQKRRVLFEIDKTRGTCGPRTATVKAYLKRHNRVLQV